MSLFKNKRILIVGDVMLDSYLFGHVERISPEAPVPIIDITNKQDKLGGAANVAKNIKNLGGTPILCSVIGKDQKGDVFLSLLKKLKIETKYILQSEIRETTVKTRVIGNNNQMLRIDEEVDDELNDDQKDFMFLIGLIFYKEKIDCVLFQDYDKGVINELVIDEITKKANKKNIPIVVDPKKRNILNYKNVTLIKPNFKEFKNGLENIIGTNIEKQQFTNSNSTDKLEFLKTGSEVFHKKGIEIIFITLSEDGIFISDKKNNISKIIPGISRDVVDVSGAGDTVISVASMLINDINIEEIAKIANMAGGLVCEEIGVVSINKKKLLKEYNRK